MFVDVILQIDSQNYFLKKNVLESYLNLLVSKLNFDDDNPFVTNTKIVVDQNTVPKFIVNKLFSMLNKNNIILIDCLTEKYKEKIDDIYQKNYSNDYKIIFLNGLYIDYIIDNKPVDNYFIFQIDDNEKFHTFGINDDSINSIYEYSKKMINGYKIFDDKLGYINEKKLSFIKGYSKFFQNEKTYLNLLSKIFNEGEYKKGRNGSTYSLTGQTMTFNIKNKLLPLITTRKQFTRGIFEELIWFLRGSTDVRELCEKGVNFWNKNTSKSFIEKQNLDIDLPEYCLGAGYGFQMRLCGANYIPFKKRKEYTNEDYNDQLEEVIKSLINQPESRRHIISLWNPCDLKKMALVPCHGLVIQFIANKINESKNDYNLDCCMYQRSGDMFHGIPFNIVSYSILTNMIAEHINNNFDGPKFYPSKLTITIGDSHIYGSHINAVKEQLLRIPYRSPTINFNRIPKNFDDWNWEDIDIQNYKFHPNVKVDMVE
jgi:thymidylate synthase